MANAQVHWPLHDPASDVAGYVDNGYVILLQRRPDGVVGHKWEIPVEDFEEHDPEIFALFLRQRRERKLAREAARHGAVMFLVPRGG